MPLYHLSNAQKKALLIDGTIVQLALPIPADSDPEDGGSVLDWAKAQLPEDVRDHATEARCVLLRVVPYPVGGRSNLTDILGAIVQEGQTVDGYTIAIDACVVTLTPRNHRRGTRPVQWPANVIHNGRPLVVQT